MPTWRSLLRDWPHSILRASEDAVGLPPGQMGNSEVGHLNLGAGRPVLQDLPRIDAAIADGSFAARPALLGACRRAARAGRRLTSSAWSARAASTPTTGTWSRSPGWLPHRACARVRVHALLDGRDTPPRSALAFLADLERRLGEVHPDARIASVGGRYYAMDRDKRWDRVERGYDAIVHGEGRDCRDGDGGHRGAYVRGENDEFVLPTVIDGGDGLVQTGDAMVHCNFRADRARELTHALVDPAFTAFDRTSPSGRPAPADLLVVTMTEYEAGLAVEVAFPPEQARSLAQAFSEAGWRQFHVAETEKYAHVTYFFNGGVEPPYPGEDRLLIPSLKVATYDLAPEMRAEAITDALVTAIGSGQLRLHRGELRQPGHGRPYREVGRHGDRAGRDRCLSRASRRRDRRGRR